MQNETEQSRADTMNQTISEIESLGCEPSESAKQVLRRQRICLGEHA